MIKFRFWDKDEKYFITEATIVLDKDGSVEGIEYYHTKLGHSVYNDISYYELLQSTGLKDKNGVEIFEGDVLKVFIFDGKGPHAKVIFKNGMFGIEDDMFGYGYDKGLYTLDQIISIRDAEVIGNIYEHPHLLEGDNE